MTETMAASPSAPALVTFGIDEALARADWKRHVSAAYQEVRASSGSREAWDRWRETRQHLYTSHAQSPVEPSERDPFRLAFFDHDPESRVLGRIEPSDPEGYEIAMSGDRTTVATRMARVRFSLQGGEHTLGLYWLEGWRGGLFLPFQDSTSGDTTYGGGRYLLDTMKSEDLGVEGDLLVLDFNFAYHPPCFYNHRYSCPLSPPENRLPVAIQAGERVP
jgi:hypothetical protein